MPFARYVASAAALVVATSPLAAQSTTDSRAAEGGWRFRPSLTSDVELDDNVFLLSDNRKAKVVGGAPIGSRYANMASASDVIATVRADVGLTGPGLAGKRLTIVPEVGYEHYARNAERRSAFYGVSLSQRLGRGEQLRASAAIQPSRFYKNYLVDAIDRDANGSIVGSERIYGSAQQAERRIDADYTVNLDRLLATGSVDATLRLGAGWYSRSYDAGFRARDLSGPTVAGELALDLARATKLDVAYSFAALSATRTRSVMLLDEPAFGRDFNGNGNATDLDARAAEMVDHSRNEHELGVSLDHDFGAAALGVEFTRRMRRYRSTEQYDLDNNGRHDTRNEIGASLRYNITPSMRFRGGVSRASQTLNRAGSTAVTGDVADYSRLRASLALEYRL